MITDIIDRAEHWEAVMSPLSLRGIQLRNRLGLPPMTLYVSDAGHVTDFHMAHYSTRAQTLGLTIVEATAVSEPGRVTPHDLGIWSDEHAKGLSKVARTIKDGGSVPGIQLSHGGRKGSRTRLWDGDVSISTDQGGWEIFGPSPKAFAPGYPVPQAMSDNQINQAINDFVAAATRARNAGFEFLELHAGHGRLFHSFYSPISNTRTDDWGGTFEKRIRLLVETVKAVRTTWPSEFPLAVRLSCVDWIEDGWTITDSVALARILKENGVDVIDCSSGGIARPIRVETAPLYQVPFARAIREGASIATAAVGRIEHVDEANTIIESGSADIVLLGRKLLLDPYAILRQTAKSAKHLIPRPYERGVRSLTTVDPLAPPEL